MSAGISSRYITRVLAGFNGPQGGVCRNLALNCKCFDGTSAISPHILEVDLGDTSPLCGSVWYSLLVQPAILIRKYSMDIHVVYW